mmetsp:Transcript_4243/g.8214  ORF Transcript_4243/g.8214 Transcript_4243/m.8214 type:complete len:111 (-) Transcript_4243:492-824(-)
MKLLHAPLAFAAIFHSLAVHGLAPSSPPNVSNNVRPTVFAVTKTHLAVKTSVRPRSSMSMSKGEGDERDERDERRRNQQKGAVAVFLVSILFDFFVTHHGIGFWDPNYVV